MKVRTIYGAESKGSYIVIKPSYSEENFWCGYVIVDNESKGYNKGIKVFYHEDDMKTVNFNEENLHIVKYYDIIIKEQPLPVTKDIDQKVKFTGMTLNF